MGTLTSSLGGISGLLVGTAIWAVLFVAILEVLRKASPFEGWTTYVLAVCVSLLSVIGMFRILTGTSDEPNEPHQKRPVRISPSTIRCYGNSDPGGSSSAVPAPAATRQALHAVSIRAT